jgi:undecaprenyl-diphosphatase
VSSESTGLDTAVALGTLQGLTEFLPVSSSGHVTLGALMFGVSEMPLAMVVVLHAGTLVATLLVVGGDVGRLTRDAVRGLARPRQFVRSESGRLIGGIVLASVPTAVLGLLLKDRVEAWSHQPWIVGLCLLGSAAAVWSTRRGDGQVDVPTARICLLVGIAQGLAVLPGLSRSGSTIATAMLLGMRASEAFRFSFLLSLPAVLGALVVELAHPEQLRQLGTPALLGGGVALVTGYGALLVLRRVVVRGRFWAFALYLVPLALTVIVWDLVR